MKKITISLAVLTGALCFATVLRAQAGDRTLAYRNIRPQTSALNFADATIDRPVSAETDTNAVTAAKAEFKKSKAEFRMAAAADRSSTLIRKKYHQAAASWQFSDKGMFATFMDNGLKTRVDFDSKGRWLHTYTYSLGDKNCPAATKETAESYYPDAVILYCIRVEESGVTGYVLTLESIKSYRTVYIENDNVILMHEVIKS